MEKLLYYHVNTKNISFLQTAVELQTMRVRNDLFFLGVYDEDLRFIDPHSPYLTDEEKNRIKDECKINPWYFLRECARIPSLNGPVPFELHRGNLAALYCTLNEISHYLTLPHNHYRVESYLTIFTWYLLFSESPISIAFFNRDEGLNKNRIEKISESINLLPPFLQTPITTTDNEIMNPNTKSVIRLKPVPRSEDEAKYIGETATETIQFFDELEYMDYAKILVTSARSNLKTASPETGKNQTRLQILTSPVGIVNVHQSTRDMQEEIEQMALFDDNMYGWDHDEFTAFMDFWSENGLIYILFDFRQLWKDRRWVEEMKKQLPHEYVERQIYLRR